MFQILRMRFERNTAAIQAKLRTKLITTILYDGKDIEEFVLKF